MPPRKERVPVVLDTNVILGFYLSRSDRSWNRQVFRWWRDVRKLQLVLSEELAAEYLEILRRLNVTEERIQRLEHRLRARGTVTWVRLGPRFTESRDPDDNILLATAKAGNARFLVSNDRDLLDLTAEQRRGFRFAIVTPEELVSAVGE